MTGERRGMMIFAHRSTRVRCTFLRSFAMTRLRNSGRSGSERPHRAYPHQLLRIAEAAKPLER